MSSVIATGALAAAGIYLLLQGSLVRIVLGFLLLQHAVNLLLVTARTPNRDDAPILPVTTPQDPLGQAFVVTAIVISFGTVLLLLAIALRHTVLRRGQEDSPGDPADEDGEEPANI